MYAYAANNPVRYIDPDGRQGKDTLNYCGKGKIVGYGYISSTIGSLQQNKDFVYKKFVFTYMTIVDNENFDSKLNELKRQSGKTYSDRRAGEVNKNIEFAVSMSADEITYDDLEFAKSTGGGIFFSEDNNPDNFSGNRPSSFLFVSKEVDIFVNPETNEIFLLNSKKEVLPIE